MAESERRSGKTPLKKQPEIEEVEEGDEETNGSPNSDVSDTTITPGKHMIHNKCIFIIHRYTQQK